MNQVKKIFLIALIFFVSGSTVSAEKINMSLTEGIKMALERNYSIEESAADLDSAYWGLREARRNTGPNLSWSTEADAVGGKAYDNWGHKEFSNQLSVTMPIYAGGRLKNNIESAKFGLSGAELTLERTKQNVRYTVSEDYFNILKCRSQVEVYRESVNNLRAHLDDVKIKVLAGTVAQKDILSSEVSLAQGEQKFVNAMNDYNVAIATFNKDVGLPTETETFATEQLNYEKYNLDLNDCENYAILHRPDLFQKEYALRQSKAEMESAKSSARPQVDAKASKSFAGDAPFKSNMDAQDSWKVGLSLNWDIWDNQVTKAQVSRKQAAVRRAEAELNDKINDVKLEVRTAFLNLQAAEENISTMKEALVKAEEDYKIEVVRYEAGVGTNLEVMDSEEKLVSAKGDYISALYIYNTSKASLDKAMGIPIDLDIEPYRNALEDSAKEGK